MGGEGPASLSSEEADHQGDGEREEQDGGGDRGDEGRCQALRKTCQGDFAAFSHLIWGNSTDQCNVRRGGRRC